MSSHEYYLSSHEYYLKKEGEEEDIMVAMESDTETKDVSVPPMCSPQVSLLPALCPGRPASMGYVKRLPPILPSTVLAHAEPEQRGGWGGEWGQAFIPQLLPGAGPVGHLDPVLAMTFLTRLSLSLSHRALFPSPFRPEDGKSCSL